MGEAEAVVEGGDIQWPVHGEGGAVVFDICPLFLQADGESRLPPANGGRGNEEGREVVDAVEIAVGDDGDSRVLFVLLGYVEYGILLALVANHELKPLVTARQRDVVYRFGS